MWSVSQSSISGPSSILSLSRLESGLMALIA